jgi:hypothetical protein
MMKKKAKVAKIFHSITPHHGLGIFISQSQLPQFFRAKEEQKIVPKYLKGRSHFCPHLSSQITIPPNLILPYI